MVVMRISITLTSALLAVPLNTCASITNKICPTKSTGTVVERVWTGSFSKDVVGSLNVAP